MGKRKRQCHSIFEWWWSRVVTTLVLFDVICKGQSNDLLQNEELQTVVSTVSELNQRLTNAKNGLVLFLGEENFVLEEPLIFNIPNVTLRGRGANQATLKCSEKMPGSALEINVGAIKIEHLLVRNCKRNSAVTISAINSTNKDVFDISFTGLRFQDNGASTSTFRGAAIRMEACLEADCVRPNITIKNCTFSRNQATIGGAIFASGCNLAVFNSVFELNEALVGGAIFIGDGKPRLSVRNSRFENNSAIVVPNVNFSKDTLVSSETRGLGGAITALELSSAVVKRCVFRNNSGYGGGGALAVRAIAPGRSSSLSVTFIVAHSIFEDNVAFNSSVEENRNVTSDESTADSAGGAIWYFITRTLHLNWHIRNSTFSNNAAYIGGAVNIFSSWRSMNPRFTDCEFRNNRARGFGGAITASDCLISILGTRFYRNIAFYGGGMMIAVQARLMAGPSPKQKRKTTFIQNEAFVGGGVYAVAEASGQFKDTVFTENVAYDRGGAFAIYGNREVISFAGGLFDSNRAVAGGAIAFITGGNLSVASHQGAPTRFVRNVALVGGALYFREGHTLLVAIALKDAVFTMNEALNYDDPRVPSIAQLMNRVARGGFRQADALVENQRVSNERIYTERVQIPLGSGGAIGLSLEGMRLYTIGDVLFRNLTIERNEAIVGGGVAVYMTENNRWNAQSFGRCLSETFTVFDCQRFIFQSVRIEENVAQFGGGLFVTHPRSVDLVCVSNKSSTRRSLYDVMSTRLSKNKDSDATEDFLCGEINANKIMGKDTRDGADVGTKAISLTFGYSDDALRETVSGEPLSLSCDDEEDGPCDRIVRVEVKDAFNQTIHGGNEDSSLTIALSSPYILGDRRYTAKSGVAEIDNTFTFGINVSSTLTISAVGRPNVEMTANFSIRGCKPGEYTQNGYCLRCPTKHYGFDGSRERCQKCDICAVCEGGAALVPDDGYWHSNPFSPYFRRCLVAKGCEYENRRKSLTSFYSNMTKLQKDLESLNNYIARIGPLPQFSSYNQCAEGYEGVFCGSCSPGYGHSFSGECKECPDEDATARLFLTLSFIWTVLVIGLNCVMTLQSTTARTQLVFEDIREAALARRPKSLPRANAMSTSRRDFNHQSARSGPSTRSISSSIEEPPEEVRDVLLATVQLTETLKILVNYLQVTSAAVQLQTEWGPGVKPLLEVQANLVGFTSVPFFTPLECNFDDDYGTPRSIIALWTRCLAPILAMLLLIAILAIQRKVIRPLIKRAWVGSGQTSVTDADRNVPESDSILTGAIVITIVSIYFSYINVVSQFLKSMNCIEVDHGFKIHGHPYGQYALLNKDRVWADDTSLLCFKGKHLLTGIGGIIGLGISALVILLVFIWLPLNKHRLKDPTFVARYWFIYQAYKREWYSTSWEAVILIRKTLVTAVIVFSVQLGPTLQAPLCVGLLILAHSAHTVCQPFRADQHKEFIPEYSGSFLKLFGADKWVSSWINFHNSVSLNSLESYSLVSSISVFFSVIIFSSPSTVQGGRVVMAAITLVFNSSFLGYMFYRLYGGLHVLLDYKLEVLDTPFIAFYQNGPGLVSAITKMSRIAISETRTTA